MSKITVVKEVINGRNSFKIDWPGASIPADAYANIRDYIYRMRDYGPIDKTKLRKLCRVLTNTNKRYKTSITTKQLKSIHHLVLKHKVISGYPRMNRVIGEIADLYNRGRDILDLSSQYDFPPLNLLRGVLIENGRDPSSLYAIFMDSVDPSTMLVGRDLDQFKRALNNDADSTFNQQEITRIAAEHEAKAIRFFRTLGIRFKTQEQLAAQQTKTFGRPIATPDLLFLDPVTINGVPISWIDYKDFILLPDIFITNKIREQAAKYYQRWGTGAMLFRYGFVDGVNIPGAIVIDTSPIPDKFIL